MLRSRSCLSKKLSIVLLLFGAARLDAQGSWEWEVTQFDNQSQAYALGQFRVRNTQVDLINGKVYALQYFNVSAGGSRFLGGGATLIGQSGSVFTGLLPAGTDPFNNRMNFGYVPSNFSTDAAFPGGFRNGTNASDWHGIFGCVYPVLSNFTGGSYAGATCAPAGYDGWQVFSFQLSYQSVEDVRTSRPPSLTASFREYGGPSTSFIPEPSTYVLMASGLLTLGVVARRRRNV